MNTLVLQKYHNMHRIPTENIGASQKRVLSLDYHRVKLTENSFPKFSFIKSMRQFDEVWYFRSVHHFRIDFEKGECYSFFVLRTSRETLVFLFNTECHYKKMLIQQHSGRLYQLQSINVAIFRQLKQLIS